MSNFVSNEISNEQVMLLDTGEKAFLHRINLLSLATKEINFVTLLTTSGYSTDVVFAALFNAADRGVTVNFIIDSQNAHLSKELYLALISHRNINFYIYNERNIFRPQNFNIAMHDKILTIDGKYMIFGGRNIGNQYYDIPSAKKTNIDSEVLVYNTQSSGGSIADSIEYCKMLYNFELSTRLTSISQNDYNTALNHRAKLSQIYYDFINTSELGYYDYDQMTVPTNKITLLTNPLSKYASEPVLAYNLLMIAKNSNRIVNVSPYLSLTSENLDYFSDVIEGKNYTLITNSTASAKNDFASFYYYADRKNVLKTGIDIYEYQSNELMLHAKGFIFDDRLTAIGSFNMDERSVRVCTESMLVIDSTQFNQILNDYYNSLLSQSLKVGSNNKYENSQSIKPAQTSWYRNSYYYIVGKFCKIVEYLI